MPTLIGNFTYNFAKFVTMLVHVSIVVWYGYQTRMSLDEIDTQL